VNPRPLKWPDDVFWWLFPLGLGGHGLVKGRMDSGNGMDQEGATGSPLKRDRRLGVTALNRECPFRSAAIAAQRLARDRRGSGHGWRSGSRLKRELTCCRARGEPIVVGEARQRQQQRPSGAAKCPIFGGGAGPKGKTSDSVFAPQDRRQPWPPTCAGRPAATPSEAIRSSRPNHHGGCDW